ncbi:hypothetical protein T4D_462 [Trichinella pseudospiralis]|uniref:Uncharacterized protein n=1 Tax=Trichinella pseudospiralis TaxID=6337 RepID=A0A0V1FYR5_TRIPS|nr:hypothetical protein T4D_462 [Trichinella pseudospiralis]
MDLQNWNLWTQSSGLLVDVQKKIEQQCLRSEFKHAKCRTKQSRQAVEKKTDETRQQRLSTSSGSYVRVSTTTTGAPALSAKLAFH